MNSFVRKLLRWYAANARDLPWRRVRDSYAIWISEIMLQQTQVKTVIPYFNRWMRALPSVEAFARARPEKVLKLWEGLGYYSRARNAHAAARLIVSQHKGRFPDKYDDVLALPGIGRYTAGAICSIAFNQPVPILDGNVIRVASRVFGISGNPRDNGVNAKLWDVAARLAASPGAKPAQINQALMELGALVCLSREPKCDACPVQSECFAFREKRVAEFPNLPARLAATHRHFIAYVARRDGRFLVRQRPAGAVNGGLWEFPNIEPSTGESASLRAAADAPFLRFRHTITRYRILLEVFHARPLTDENCAGVWKTKADLKRLAFTSAHRRIADFLLATEPRAGGFGLAGK